MRSTHVIFNNAICAANTPNARALRGEEPVWWRTPEQGAGASELLPLVGTDDAQCLSRFWAPDAFWVPTHEPHGLPLLAVKHLAVGEEYVRLLTDRGVEAELVTDPEDVYKTIFRCITVLAFDFKGEHTPYHVWIQEWADLETVDWLADPWGPWNAHADAYCKWRSSKLLATEDVWGTLGAWPWGELERLLGEVDSSGKSVDPVLWERLWTNLDRGDVGKALMWGDQLWNRENRFKKRNYFDICTLFIVTRRVWDEVGCGELYREVAELVLYDCVAAGMGYERMLFTCFWLWTTQYWQPLCEYALKTRILYSNKAQWSAICKETTAMVTQSWMFPLSNRQHIASSYFLNAEDLLGFSDADATKGEITVEVLKYALGEFHYTYPGESAGERTFDDYLIMLRKAAYSLLQPIYATYADKAQDRSTFMDTRTAWAAGGVAGRRSRDVLGNEISPPGCAKAYVMTKTKGEQWSQDWGRLYIEVAGKQDERGAERTLSATDMRDQAGESFVFHPLRNRYPMVGLDMGESPSETMARHLHLISASEGPGYYMHDGRVLVAWDWSKWDHFVHLSEHVVVLMAMRDLIRRYVRGGVREEMLAEVDYIERGHREAVFRSQVYADEQYGRVVDELIASSKGRAQRLNETSVLVREPAGQQSGRRTTLEVNTIIGTSRLLVRDSELIGCSPGLRQRTSVYVLNRADDVAEVFDCYKKGVAAVMKMLEQGHRANPKKQVAQWRSIVYFRILYSGGAMRAFPPRAVYAACSGHPDKGSGSETSPMDKLRSVCSGLEMWARRGGWLRMAQALYADAEHFFSKTRIWTKEAYLNPSKPLPIARIDKRVLRAAPEMGGLGILPVGEYEFDYSVRVGRGRYEEDEKWWRELADGKAAELVSAPGVVDLERHASGWVTEACGIKPLPGEVLRFRKKWAGSRIVQDGQGKVLTWRRNAAVCAAIRHVGVNEHVSVHRAPWESWPIRASLLRFKQAGDRSRRAIGAKEVLETLRDIRGPPAYGMFKSQFFGYGDVIYNERPEPEVLRALAGGSALGRDYLAEADFLPDWIKVEHLCGRLGAVGGWSKLLPASWAGWLDATVNKAVFEACKASPTAYCSKLQFLYTRARATSFAMRLFRSAYPRLFLH